FSANTPAAAQNCANFAVRCCAARWLFSVSVSWFERWPWSDAQATLASSAVTVTQQINWQITWDDTLPSGVLGTHAHVRPHAQTQRASPRGWQQKEKK